MRKLFLLISLSAIFVSCKKENTQDHCIGHIQLINNSSNPYQVSLNGKAIANMPGGTLKVLDVDAAYDTVKVLQLSGYILYPTEKTYMGNVECNKIMVVSFP